MANLKARIAKLEIEDHVGAGRVFVGLCHSAEEEAAKREEFAAQGASDYDLVLIVRFVAPGETK